MSHIILDFPGYIVKVDYDKPIEELIRMGNYQIVDDDISNKSYSPPLRGVDQIAIFILSFEQEILRTPAILSEMDSFGVRPATDWELLWMRIGYPHLPQLEKGIVALGSPTMSRKLFLNRNMAVCIERDSPRSVSIFQVPFDMGWTLSKWGFAAVR